MAKPTPEQLAKINQFTEEELIAEDVYVHEYLMLGTKYIPSRKIQFDRSLLQIYLQNLTSFDVVQIANHDFSGFDTGILPYGRFFDGEIRDDGDVASLYGIRYMIKGMSTYINAFTTDDINRMINTGILKDSSVSVTFGFSQCSICGNDIRDYENCQHWPGRTYKVDGKEIECGVIAKPAQPPKVDSSTMLENSDVVAGAYESARVNPKKSLSASGDKSPDVEKMVILNNIADLKLVNKDAPVFCCLSSTSATFHVEGESERDPSELDQLYHLMYSEPELPEGWTKAKLAQKHKENVKALLDAGHVHTLRDALDGTLPDTLKAKSVKGSDDPVGMTTEEQAKFDTAIAENAKFRTDLAAKDSEITTLNAKVEELTPQAELGKKYREDIIEAALKSGVRDQGNDFQEELYAKMFESLGIDEIKALGQKWEDSALEKLGIPKGHTKGEELKLPGEGTAPAVDPKLYKV